MIKEWLEFYHPSNKDEAEQALREFIADWSMLDIWSATYFNDFVSHLKISS